MCAVPPLQFMITRHIALGVYDYRRGLYHFSLLRTLSNLDVALNYNMNMS